MVSAVMNLDTGEAMWAPPLVSWHVAPNKTKTERLTGLNHQANLNR
jgi:hypothetical protein